MNPLSWLRTGGFRAALWPVLWTVFCPATILRAADPGPAAPSAQTTVAASLAYQQTDYSLVNWGVSLTPQTTPFKNEPPGLSGKIFRGVLNLGGAGNAIPFIWQRDARRLFLDLNRNRDFTNAGVFSAHGSSPAYSQTFTNVHLSLVTPQGRCQVFGDINFWDYNRQQAGCYLSLRSFWQGKVNLRGQNWQVGVIPNLSGQSFSFESGQLLLRPWQNRDKAFNAYNNSLDAFSYARKIFAGGHAYQLDCQAAAQDGEARLALQFTEQSVALGEVKITGKYIERLTLPGGTYLVVLDQPGQTTKVPTGSYNQPNVLLQQGGVEAFHTSSQAPAGKRISVDGNMPVTLDVGGPLTNAVGVSRHGQDLRLDYRLLGAGGANYQLANQDSSHPPEFAIYKADKKIASGKFEFG
jgi:hypothetical protein